MKFGDDFKLDPGEDIGAFPYGHSDVYTHNLVDEYNGVDFTVQALPMKKLLMYHNPNWY